VSIFDLVIWLPEQSLGAAIRWHRNAKPRMIEVAATCPVHAAELGYMVPHHMPVFFSHNLHRIIPFSSS